MLRNKFKTCIQICSFFLLKKTDIVTKVIMPDIEVGVLIVKSPSNANKVVIIFFICY